jgi:zinc protease
MAPSHRRLAYTKGNLKVGDACSTSRRFSYAPMNPVKTLSDTFATAARRLPFLLIVLLLAAGVAARAGQPASGSASSVTAGVRETVLPNGLKVVTKEVHSAPVVSFSVWYKVGSRNEHTGITGVSHLLEHLMFKGTKQYGLGEISRTLFINGASFNASTSQDWTNYYETVASDRLEMAMAIEADRMVNSRIDKADLDSEMTVVRSELEGRENSPSTLLYQNVVATAFEAHPYQWPIIGWRTDVENVSRDAIYQYYKAHYGPNNATMVIVGDFQTEPTLAMVRKHFGKIKPIPAPPQVYTQEAPQRGERRLTLRRAGALPMVMVGYKGPEGKHPDFHAIDVLQTILSAGRTSRLYQGLVEKQIATEADMGAPNMRDPFLIYLFATATPGGTPEKLEEALLAEVERVKKEPVTAEELTRAKSQIEAQFVFQNNSVTSQANQLGYWAMVADWRYLSTYLEKIRAVTPADLQRVAQKYFVPETRTVGHFIPTVQAGPGGPPPREASARVEKPQRGDRPIPLPKPSKTSPASRNVTRFKLDNGISVVVQENTSSPTLALRGSIPAGNVFNPKDKPILAELTAGMLSRGTEKRSAREFAAALENVGASLSASADTLTTNVTGRAQSKDFDLLVEMLAEMLRQPSFPQADLERLKAQYVASYEQARDDPESLATRAFERAIYPEGHPLRPDTLEATQRAIGGISREDVVRFYREQYGPEGMILVIAGDVKADRVRTALQQLLSPWPKNPQAKPIPAIDVVLQDKPVREVVRLPDKSEAAILWGHAGGLRRKDPDFYAVQVMNMILGGGGALSSRLGNVIRDEQGLVYTVFSFFDSDLYPGPFQVSLGTNPANAEKAIASLQAEVRRMVEQGVTQREVDEVVAYLTGSFPVRLETNAGMANTLWAMEFYNLGPDYIEKYGDYYRGVTVPQANEAAKKHLHPDRATLIISGTLPEK